MVAVRTDAVMWRVTKIIRDTRLGTDDDGGAAKIIRDTRLGTHSQARHHLHKQDVRVAEKLFRVTVQLAKDGAYD